MAGAIEWGRLSGETVETIIATYIGRNHIHAQRIRPSVGDGGIDVIDHNDDGSVDIYQIKKFASNLNVSQKKQIEKSWQRACEYANSRNMQMKHWYLVMPLDPTKENLEWFKALTANTKEVSCEWIGLLKVDSWASQMPEVADYFIDNRSREIHHKVCDLLEAAHEPDITKPDELIHHLTSLSSCLNAINPYYSFSVYSCCSQDHNIFQDKPSLMYTQSTCIGNGRAIVLSCFAKFDAAPQLEPTMLSFRILAKTSAEQKAFNEWIDYGIPFTSLPVTIDPRKSHEPYTLMNDSKAISETITLKARSNSHAFPIILISHNSRIALQYTDFYSGRKGYVWKGRDAANVFSLSLKGDFSTNTNKSDPDSASQAQDLQVSLQIHVWNCAGKQIDDCLTVFRFLANLLSDHEMTIQHVNGVKWAQGNVFLDDKTMLALVQNLLHVCEDLHVIRCHSDIEFTFPDLKKTPVQTVNEWHRIALLLQGLMKIYHRSSIYATALRDESLKLPCGMIFDTPLTTQIGGQSIFLGYLRSSWNVDGVKKIPINATQFKWLLSASDEIGDICVERYIPSIPNGDPENTQIYAVPVQDLSKQAAQLEESENNRPTKA